MMQCPNQIAAKLASEAGLWYNSVIKMLCTGATCNSPMRELHLRGGVTMDILYPHGRNDNTPTENTRQDIANHPVLADICAYAEEGGE